MKIIALSDTHGYDFYDKVDTCDLLIIAGDISPVRMDHSFYTQRRWFENDFVLQLQRLLDKAKNIVFIGGNHDTYFSECNISDNTRQIKKVLPDNVYYLCDELVEIEGVRIYGSPWCNLPSWARQGPPVWNFAASDEKKLPAIYSSIPHDIDILVTHGPAFGFCDSILDEQIVQHNKQAFGSNSDRLGSKALTEAIVRGLRPKYVISGHIHSANHNFEIYKRDLESDPVRFVCVSILDEDYNMSDSIKPLVINYSHEQAKERQKQTDS